MNVSCFLLEDNKESNHSFHSLRHYIVAYHLKRNHVCLNDRHSFYCIATSFYYFLCLIAVDGQWGPFSNWSSCSQTCGGGVRTRQRECNNPPPSNGGLDCVGSEVRQRRCNNDACPGEKSINGSWKCMDKI